MWADAAHDLGGNDVAVLVEFDVLDATQEQMYALEERTRNRGEALGRPPGVPRRLSGQSWTRCSVSTSRLSVPPPAMCSSARS